MGKKKQHLRFAAGSPDERRSSVWSVITNPHRSDVYIGQRRAMGMMKISLHEGQWRLAFTKESGSLVPGTENRTHPSWIWVPQPEFSRGWTQGPSIFLPHPGSVQTFPADVADRAKSIRWIEGPAADHVLGFTVLLATADAALPAPVRSTDTKVGQIPFLKGNVVVYARQEPMNDELRTWTDFVLDDMRIHTPDPASVV